MYHRNFDDLLHTFMYLFLKTVLLRLFWGPKTLVNIGCGTGQIPLVGTGPTTEQKLGWHEYFKISYRRLVVFVIETYLLAFNGTGASSLVLAIAACFR